MKTPRWVDSSALVLLHGEALAEHGGLPGLRDRALLESALARPQHISQYETEVDVPRLAAAYAFGIVKNHPFNDGNKRVGFVAAALFLELNQFRLKCHEADAIQTVLSLASGRLREEGLIEWFRSRCSRQK